jgi:hypothetical protein
MQACEARFIAWNSIHCILCQGPQQRRLEETIVHARLLGKDQGQHSKHKCQQYSEYQVVHGLII